MKRTLVLCVSWKGPCKETSDVLRELQALGASKMEYVGVTDVSLARCKGIAEALDACASAPQLETMLMLDDDVVPTPSHAQALIDVSRKLDGPVSGVYGTRNGKVAATHLGFDVPPDRAWLVGLGFFAVPILTLRKLGEELPHVTQNERKFPTFCRTGIHPDAPTVWTSEDYWLCRELGGVRLEPIPARHYKPAFVDVPERTLEAVRRVNRGELPPAGSPETIDDREEA